MRRLALLPLLLLAACGGDEQASSGPSPATTAAPEAAQERREMQVDTVAQGLEVPWDLAFLPGGDALVTERPGRVRLLEDGERLRGEPVAEVPVTAEGEGGLMGIAVDPRFEDNGFVYVLLTRSPSVVLQRFTYDEETREWAEGPVLLDDVVAGPVHDSGRIRFGPDGRLYVLTGDAGQAALAQDPGSLNGKVLRLTAEQARGDREVADPEVFTTGHRNPQGLDWDADGRLIATEHGPSGGDGPQGFDEVNVLRRGRNYGWPEVIGTDHGRFAAPARVYEEAIAPSGAAYLDAESAWQGSYVLAALRGTALHRLTLRDGEVAGEEVLLEGEFGRLRAVVEAPDGSLYVTTSNRDGRGDPAGPDDRVLRIAPPT
jgi:glucose/arabinose dehydrogenase